MKVFKITKFCPRSEHEIVNRIGKVPLIGEGIIFYDNKVVIQWKGDITSICIYDSFDDFLKLNDKSKIIYLNVN